MGGLRDWAKTLKRDVVAVSLAVVHPRTPWHARLVAGMVAAYGASPIDLIPDFIPVLGLLDDLVLLPAGIALVIRLIPKDILEECRAEADRRQTLPLTLAGAALVGSIWVVSVLGIWWLISSRLGKAPRPPRSLPP